MLFFNKYEHISFCNWTTQLITQYNKIEIVYKQSLAINFLFSLKDKDSCDSQSNAFYKINCLQCGIFF